MSSDPRNATNGASAGPLAVRFTAGAADASAPPPEYWLDLPALEHAGFDTVVVDATGPDPIAYARRIPPKFRIGVHVTTPGTLVLERVRALIDERDVAFVTVALGSGLWTDDRTNLAVEEMLRDRNGLAVPAHVMIRRGTVTQDAYRTLALVKRYPELTFCGDFAEWYAGHEMILAEPAKKIRKLAPVLERVRMIEGFVATSERMPAEIDAERTSLLSWPLSRATAGLALRHFKRMWTKSAEASAVAGAIGSFAYVARVHENDRPKTGSADAVGHAQAIELAKVFKRCRDRGIRRAAS